MGSISFAQTHQLVKHDGTAHAVNFIKNENNISNIGLELNNLKSFKAAVAILLQRSESYLFLRVGCKAVNERFPDVPFLTIHDSILIEEQYSEVVTPILKESLNSVTGIETGINVKEISDPMTTLEFDVEEIWNDIIKE